MPRNKKDYISIPSDERSRSYDQMSDTEFESFASKLSIDDRKLYLRECLDEFADVLKRDAAWNYVVGRWFTFVRAVTPHGELESLYAELGISPSFVSRRCGFYEKYKGMDLAKAFGNERFSLDRSLGYVYNETTTGEPNESEPTIFQHGGASLPRHRSSRPDSSKKKQSSFQAEVIRFQYEASERAFAYTIESQTQRFHVRISREQYEEVKRDEEEAIKAADLSNPLERCPDDGSTGANDITP